jgi:hypothetical protein
MSVTSTAVAARPSGSTGSRVNPTAAGNPQKRVTIHTKTMVALSRMPNRSIHRPGTNKRLTASRPWKIAARSTKAPTRGRMANSSGRIQRWVNCDAHARAAAA